LAKYIYYEGDVKWVERCSL